MNGQIENAIRDMERLQKSGVLDKINEIERLKRSRVFDNLDRYNELASRKNLIEERYLDKIGRREIERRALDNFDRLRDVNIPPFVNSIHSANQQMFKMLEDIKKREQSYLGNINIHRDWEKQFNFLQDKYTLSRYDAVESHIATIAQINTFAESSLLSISQNKIGLEMKISEIDRNIFSSNFQNLSNSYEHLTNSFVDGNQNLFSISPEISRLSAIEYFNATDLVVSISLREVNQTEFEEEKSDVREIIYLETQDILDYLLSEINNDFIKMRQGAKQALKSTNPDRIRHFITSYRELFTHIVHTLAPDKEIKEWTTDAEFFSNGRPTRKARMLYIYRNNNQSQIKTFIEKDIDSTLEAMNLFQKGTHATDSSFTEFQLKALEIRIEATLRLLLESNRIENLSKSQNHSKSLEQLVKECEVDTGTEDLAAQHDHYLYGKSKK